MASLPITPPSISSLSITSSRARYGQYSMSHDTGTDLEGGCPFPVRPRAGEVYPKRRRRLRHIMFGSRIDRKIQNPASCRSIGYNIHDRPYLFWFTCYFVLFVVECLLIHYFHARVGLTCGVEGGSAYPPSVPQAARPPMGRQTPSQFVVFGEVLSMAFITLLLMQGHMNFRGARERMEHIRHTATTMTDLLLRETTKNARFGTNDKDLQLVIYECLCLITAYPVALLQQMQGNTYEPDISEYSRQMAITLQYLRDGGDERDLFCCPRFPMSDGPLDFEKVPYFFERWSLQLEKEFREQAVRSKLPTVGPQSILSCIRHNLENLVEKVDMQLAPILRENIAMMALTGRELTTFAYHDGAPAGCLWVSSASVVVSCIAIPVHNCEMFTAYDSKIPTAMDIVAMLGLSAVGAGVLCLLLTLWAVWDPFRRGLNIFAWTLGIAMDVDVELNYGSLRF
ncbi:hypothetical protein B0J13DRAFT_54509 [Dactylonectria estremocensis]|uniref:Uncharacterized protein n=1 Tax=Dactylonectria estremocensis TaxID=1079267 RepID=A0A9P9EPZ4_9HYPO|nr:hypothetical protein B0J13DRAFT_54509 [Dactylonectria estremocensis]